MRRAFWILAVAALQAACNEPFSNEDILFLKALPTAEQVEVRIPQGLTTCTTAPTAAYYLLGRDFSKDVNNGLTTVLTIVTTIARYPVTERKDDLRIWGPWTENGVDSRFSIKFVETATIVRATSTSTAAELDGYYEYLLEQKRSADPEYTPAIFGRFAPTNKLETGMGLIILNFEGIRRNVNPASEDRGVLALAYDNRFEQSTVEGVIDFELNGEEVLEKPEGYFRFEERADGSRKFEFVVQTNLDNTNEDIRELLYIRTRYTADERGRADVGVTGGELGAAVFYINECWDECLQRTYLDGNVPDQPRAGMLSACAPELQASE